MTNPQDDSELHVDIIRILARHKDVTNAIQPALDAMQEGMAALRTEIPPVLCKGTLDLEKFPVRGIIHLLQLRVP